MISHKGDHLLEFMRAKIDIRIEHEMKFCVVNCLPESDVMTSTISAICARLDIDHPREIEAWKIERYRRIIDEINGRTDRGLLDAIEKMLQLMFWSIV